jgi:regulator of sigma E protease
MSAATNLIINIVEFVLALGVLAFLHELGHFVISKLCKIDVEEFGFGFPPRLVKLFTLGGTDFTLNWIPFGAFVRPKGENDPEVPGGLASANPWARLAVLFGGPVMNLLTGVLLFTMVFTRTGAPDTKTVQVIEATAGSPAATAGLAAGDVITAIDGSPITSTQMLSNLVHDKLGQQITLTYQRNNQTHQVTLVPRTQPPAGQGPLGITMSNPIVPITWYQAVPFAAYFTYEQAHQLILLPGRLIQGQVSPQQSRLVGPVGMFDIYAQARTRDEQSSTAAGGAQPPAVNTLFLIATISVALGLTNLLPIPALDGGRIIFVLPEILIHKRVPPQYENMVHLIGFAALILIMVYVTTQDIMNPIVLP